MEQMGKPLLLQVIPAIDSLTSRLEDTASDRTLNIVVCAAALSGAKVLNKYYSKIDESIMPRMAMMLHPKYKFSYFVQKDWPQEWIDEAKTIMRLQLQRYKPDPIIVVDEPSSSQVEIMNDLFDMDIDKAPVDELEEYMSSPHIPTVSDPIRYWRQFLPSPLARIALDFLSAPASSTDIERGFSRVLSSWVASGIGELVVEDDLLTLFRNKSKRGKSSTIIEIDEVAASSD
ncbi:hypothetical protein OF83DRAFT_1178464 [Amylostereum chailletii]|nr:hypothetical protein OF83DRAFT_1178464 [Amylostereum chailletii]